MNYTDNKRMLLKRTTVHDSTDGCESMKANKGRNKLVILCVIHVMYFHISDRHELFLQFGPFVEVSLIDKTLLIFRVFIACTYCHLVAVDRSYFSHDPQLKL